MQSMYTICSRFFDIHIYIYNNPVVFLSNGPDHVFFWGHFGFDLSKKCGFATSRDAIFFRFLSGKQTVPTKTERCGFFPIMTRKLWVCGFPGMCMYNYIYIAFYMIYIYILLLPYHILP